MRRVAVLAAVPFVAGLTGLTGLAALAGCSQGSDTVAAQARAGDAKGYVAGDGTVEQLAPAQRRTELAVSGTTLDGQPLDTAGLLGKVVVVNTWGSWCPPCNAEAPGLQRTWAGLKGQDVQFVGVDVREGKDAGLAFQRRMKLTYPSLVWDGGQVLLQLKGKATTTPTTLVIDRKGRLAGRISGEAKGSTLREMVLDVLAEDGS
jgi:thiol-disulfide isomerase/thioredoxin